MSQAPYVLHGARQGFKFGMQPQLEDLLCAALQDPYCGLYMAQTAEKIAKRLRAPLITGKTPHNERDVLFDDFRTGRINLLVVSKVANFSIDLPDANIAIQISGTFGSRQEEAQRLGRVLRPKADGGAATFYTLVSEETREQEFARRRQLFLTEQGYAYEIRAAAELERASEVEA